MMLWKIYVSKYLIKYFFRPIIRSKDLNNSDAFGTYYQIAFWNGYTI